MNVKINLRLSFFPREKMDELQQLLYERNVMKTQLKEKYSELSIRQAQIKDLLNYITRLEQLINRADDDDDVDSDNENLTNLLQEKRRQYELIELEINTLCLDISILNLNIGRIEDNINSLRSQH